MTLGRRPIIITAVGVLVLAAGLTLGRIPYTVPGGFHQSAYTTDHMCRWAHQLQATAGQTPMCQHAADLMVLAGAAIVTGVAVALAGVVLTVRRRRHR